MSTKNGASASKGCDPPGLPRRDIDIAVRLIKETQADLRFPANVEPSMNGGKHVGTYSWWTDTIKLDRRYSGNLTDAEAADLLDTIIHEALHANDPVWKQLLDSFRKHPDIVDEAARRSGELLERYLLARRRPSDLA